MHVTQESAPTVERWTEILSNCYSTITTTAATTPTSNKLNRTNRTTRCKDKRAREKKQKHENNNFWKRALKSMFYETDNDCGISRQYVDLKIFHAWTAYESAFLLSLANIHMFWTYTRAQTHTQHFLLTCYANFNLLCLGTFE